MKREASVDGALAPDGYGRSFTVQDLQMRERAELKARVSKELWEEGVQAVRTMKQAEAAMTAVKVALHRGLGEAAAGTLCRMMIEAAAVPVELPKVADKKRK